MFRKAVTLSLFAVSLAALSLAQTKPNLTGNWKLNVAKSDFGVMPPPESQTSIITHAEPAFKVETSSVGQQGKVDYTIDLTTDGKEASVKMGPRDVKISASWDGPALVLTSKLTFNEQDVNLKTALTLAEDGTTLTENVHIVSAMGELDQKLLFDKLPDGAAAPTKDTETHTTQTTQTTPPATPGGVHPNFSGVWKLNVAKSDFGVIPPPESRVDTIEHSDPALKLSRDEIGAQGTQKYVVNTSSDGKEVVNTMGEGIEAHVTATWESQALVSNIKLKTPDADITIKQVSSISADGKILTNKNHIVSPMGELDMTEVYEKQ